MKWLVAAALAAFFSFALSAAATPATATATVRSVDFGTEAPSREAHDVAQWAVLSGDHKGLPFAIVDKANARLYAFDARGRLIQAAPVLIGMGIGDKFAPGVAQMDMYDTKPWQRVTPAGRFVAEVYEKGRGRSTVWVDYDTGIALHKMPTKKTAQRRAERMASPVPADHRITYGCINVLPAFYDAVVYPMFKPKGGIVYVLPEELPLQAVFKSFTVGGPLHLRQTQYIAR